MVSVVLMFALAWCGFKTVRSQNHSDRTIEEIFEAWKKSPEDKQLYTDLQKAVARVSGPHPIRMQIAQSLLFLGQTEEAKAVSKESLTKLQKISPEHAEFSEISFLISSQHYQEALERSVSLKESLKDASSVLYGENLVRIALLQQKLENRAGEIAAWDELQNFMGEKESVEILDGLGNRKIGFQAYLNERKKAL